MHLQEIGTKQLASPALQSPPALSKLHRFSCFQLMLSQWRQSLSLIIIIPKIRG